MTVKDVLEYVDDLYENSFDEQTKLIWINQIEAEIQAEVLLLAVDGIVQYEDQDLFAELIAPPPFDKIYPEYLIWRIMLAQEETERANNQQIILDEAWKAYARFVAETVDPKSGMAETLRYYISAYQVSVKHGYIGTEAEWVKSLKGDKGDTGAGLNIRGQVASEAELPALGRENAGVGYFVGEGADALLFIWDGKEWFFKQSLKGEPGKNGYTPQKGIDYFDGENGITPHIGGNGNWYIGNTDTGIKAQGENGVGITNITERKISGVKMLYIALSDGTEKGFTLPAGPKGDPGKDGDDYVLTEADKQEIAEMAAELVDVPGGGETPGVDGEDGGYYTPTVTQPNANTMRVAFSPSKSDMPSVEAKDIALPSGSPGADGEDGVSPTLSVSKSGKVTTITIKDANGTKTAQINDGSDGGPGQDGEDGVGISTIRQTTTSAEDGGSNVFTVTLTNGQTATFTVKNGSKGSQGNPGKDGSPGADGSDGYTPVRGTDYWTDADKAEIKSYVDDAILGGAW